MTLPTPADKIQPITHLGWQVRRSDLLAERFADARRCAEQAIVTRQPGITPEQEAAIRREYRDEAVLHTRVEDLASQLLDAAGQLGWGSGEALADAHDWLERIADQRGLIPVVIPRPPTRRDVADRAIQRAFRRIGERDGFRCRTCGIDRTLTVDHVIAVANGGGDEDENLQLLCRVHNSQKGTR